MRIISVNVNGIQTAVERGLLSWLQAQNADVICLQDTRASAFELDDPAYQLDGYFLYACEAEVPAQGGVALYSRLQPKAVITGLGFETADRYGRYLQADFDKVSIATLLLPSGQNGDEDLNQKFKLMDDFARYLDKQRRKRREYIYCGSLYVAQQKLDIKNWRDSQQSPGFLAPERAWMDEIVGNMGYVDALREASRGKQGGRTLEIQRLIGRSLRAALDMSKLGDITLYVDCDVIQADGGTRTASITGAMVALVDALKVIKKRGGLKSGDPIKQMIAAVSVGMYQGEPVLDLDYPEDSAAETDLNVVMTSTGGFIEVQGTAEGAPFQPDELNAMLALAQKGMTDIFALQHAALAD